MARHEAGQLSVGDAEVESIVKQTCELLIIVLTGGNVLMNISFLHSPPFIDIGYLFIAKGHLKKKLLYVCKTRKVVNRLS